jgi:hypothetical protein
MSDVSSTMTTTTFNWTSTGQPNVSALTINCRLMKVGNFVTLTFQGASTPTAFSSNVPYQFPYASIPTGYAPNASTACVVLPIAITVNNQTTLGVFSSITGTVLVNPMAGVAWSGTCTLQGGSLTWTV